MPRQNRIDPWGDLHAIDARGTFTGNRGCLVDDQGRVVRHHSSNLWITCRTSFRDWRHPLDAPHRWTPVFFLDDVVALAAGHRPCATCRREDYESYRDAVTASLGRDAPILAAEIDRRLAQERLRRGRGLDRRPDRMTWRADIDDLPDGTVYLDDGIACAVRDDRTMTFGFAGWDAARHRPGGVSVDVLTPPTSVGALRAGFQPDWHPSASG